jgi:uncharacterized protein YndB with AHSA1/START domain
MDRIIGGFDVDTYSDAPLRVRRMAYFDAPPGDIFAVISDHGHLDRWLPLVERVYLNRGHADVRNGVGTTRYLHTAFFTIREYVIAYDPPRLLAYSIEQNTLVIDHVSVVYVEPERYGGTYLTWQHYFRTSTLPIITQPLVSFGLYMMFTGTLQNLAHRYSGRLISQIP